ATISSDIIRLVRNLEGDTVNKRILTALIFVLAGCGRGDGTPPSGLDPSVLAGTWALPCENYGNGWVIEELAFSGNSMRRTVSNFEDSGCTTATRYVSVDHDFVIPASSEIVVGAYDVNLTVVASEALIFDEEIAEDFSATGRCEIDSWPTGDAVDLSNAPAGCYEGDFPPVVGAA